MNVEAVETLAGLIGRYGVTVIGLVIVSWGLFRLIKRVLDKNDAREKELTEKFMEQNDKFSVIGRQFIEALNSNTKSSTELVETNRMLANEIKIDIASINDNMQDLGKDIGIILDRMNNKKEK